MPKMQDSDHEFCYFHSAQHHYQVTENSRVRNSERESKNPFTQRFPWMKFIRRIQVDSWKTVLVNTQIEWWRIRRFPQIMLPESRWILTTLHTLLTLKTIRPIIVSLFSLHWRLWLDLLAQRNKTIQLRSQKVGLILNDTVSINVDKYMSAKCWIM